MDPQRRGGGRGRVLGAVSVAFLCGLILWASAGARAADEESPSKSTRSSRASKSAELSRDAIEQKLDEILSNQQKILQRLDEVMEELKIVKIRATLK